MQTRGPQQGSNVTRGTTGDVWVAFDHIARLAEAFNQQPDNFVAFPAPVKRSSFGTSYDSRRLPRR